MLAVFRGGNGRKPLILQHVRYLLGPVGSRVVGPETGKSMICMVIQACNVKYKPALALSLIT